MSKKIEGEGAESYVQQVRESTQQFSSSLLDDNQDLRKVLAGHINEKLAYHEQNRRLLEDLDEERRERAQLLGQLARLDSEHRRFAEEYVVVEQQNANLANLYVASYRLHATLERSEVLAVLQEIVINLIGCEELAIFELSLDGRALDLAASFGIDATGMRHLTPASGVIGRTARTGERWIRGDGGGEPDGEPDGVAEEARLTACIPLKLSGQVTGVIALFRLLEHKNGLEAIDLELFDLLATHAATALLSSLMYARLRAAGIRW